MKFKSHCIYAYSCNVKEPDEQTVNKTDYLNRCAIHTRSLISREGGGRRYFRVSRYFRNSTVLANSHAMCVSSTPAIFPVNVPTDGAYMSSLSPNCISRVSVCIWGTGNELESRDRIIWRDIGKAWNSFGSVRKLSEHLRTYSVAFGSLQEIVGSLRNISGNDDHEETKI